MGSASRANGEALEAALDAERAAGCEPDPRSWAAVDVAERYVIGQATDDELRVARAAARAAQVQQLIHIIEEHER